MNASCLLLEESESAPFSFGASHRFWWRILLAKWKNEKWIIQDNESEWVCLCLVNVVSRHDLKLEYFSPFPLSRICVINNLIAFCSRFIKLIWVNWPHAVILWMLIKSWICIQMHNLKAILSQLYKSNLKIASLCMRKTHVKDPPPVELEIFSSPFGRNERCEIVASTWGLKKKMFSYSKLIRDCDMNLLLVALGQICFVPHLWHSKHEIVFWPRIKAGRWAMEVNKSFVGISDHVEKG